DGAGDRYGSLALSRRERRRDRRHGERTVAERTGGETCDERRVDAAGERDEGAAEVGDRRLELGDAAHESPAAASAAAQTVFTERPVARAIAAQSSCSGATLTTRPSSRATLTRIEPPSMSTTRSSRSSSYRLPRVI